MSTIINTPGNSDSSEGGSGWAVAVIILIVVIGVGAYFWTKRAPAEDNGGTNINVTLPPADNNPPSNP